MFYRKQVYVNLGYTGFIFNYIKMAIVSDTGLLSVNVKTKLPKHSHSASFFASFQTAYGWIHATIILICDLGKKQ